MNPALETFFADLLAAGVTLAKAREVRQSYARALSLQNEAVWTAFYRAVFVSLSGVAAAPQTPTRLSAQASLLRLLEDDLGSTLFSQSEMTNVRRQDRTQERLGGDAILQL